MAQETIKVFFHLEWETKQTDLSNCTACNDIIFSDMHIPFFVCGQIRADVAYKLCESCYNELNHENI